VAWADSTATYGRVTINPYVTDTPVVPEQKMPEPTKPTEPKMGMGANIKFKVPANTLLYVDGKLTVLTGTERVFTTPPLAIGQKFFYEVKAELVVAGNLVTEEKRVVVESGADLTESFPKLLAASENKSAVTSK
jgi:uncharacterized protein (TIGR03000 family)